MPTELEQRARELLAAEYDRDGRCNIARDLRLGFNNSAIDMAIRAIAAALQAQQPDTVSAAEVFRSAGGDIECSPTPSPKQALDCLRDLRACYDESLAQQPGAQAVASDFLGWVRRAAIEKLRSDDEVTGVMVHDEERTDSVKVYLRPQPPSIPEPSEEDVEAASKAWVEGARAVLTTYTARLRERIGGGREQ